MSFFIKYKKFIMVVTILIILIFLGSIAYIGLSTYSRGGNRGLTAARVGNKQISFRDLDRLTNKQANQLRSRGIDVDEDMLQFLQQQTLASMISEEIANQAAQKAGLYVSDYEVAYDIQASPWFAVDGKFDKNQYEYALRSAEHTTPAEFENQYRRDKLANNFRRVLYSFYKLTPEEVKWAYQTQHGNLTDFDSNKADFMVALMDTKTETALKAFFEDFNSNVKVQTFLQ